MKRLILYTLGAFLLLNGGCASNRKAAKSITVSPSPNVVAPDSASHVQLDMMFHVPEHYLSRRCRMILTPQLWVSDSLYGTYRPAILDAPIYFKKTNRRVRLEGYVDEYVDQAVKMNKVSRAYDLPYRETVSIPEEVDQAVVRAVVESDGCGVCRTIDTVDVARVSNPVMIMEEPKENMQLNWIEPQFVIRPKVVEGRGVAHLQFKIDFHKIDLNMGNNRRELDSMLCRLAPVVSDSLATLTSLEIVGMASADGSLAYNTPLAYRRARSAKDWLVKNLNLTPQQTAGVKVGCRPEGWAPVLEAMVAAGDADSVQVARILRKYAGSNDDVQEYFIRRLPCWRNIRNNYLQKDRKVEYVYTYNIKSFTTDEELLFMYEKRPDAFNEEELLRVAALADTPERKKEVYQTITYYFPQSYVATNNLAVLYLREGNSEKARSLMTELAKYDEEALNTLAVTYVYENDYERAIELLEQIDTPQARYNLGVLKARMRQLGEAYELLREFGDVNSAICALSVNRNEEADTMLRKLDDQSPVAEYVRALVAARLANDAEFFLHLPSACREERLRKRAKGEGDFLPYFEREEFVEIVNGQN